MATILNLLGERQHYRNGGAFPKGKHTSFVMNIMSAETNGTTSYSVYVK